MSEYKCGNPRTPKTETPAVDELQMQSLPRDLIQNPDNPVRHRELGRCGQPNIEG